jgi:hypothetical protein
VNERKPYPSEVPDEHRALIEPVITARKQNRVGRSATGADELRIQMEQFATTLAETDARLDGRRALDQRHPPPPGTTRPPRTP